jgi:hypothetical protein
MESNRVEKRKEKRKGLNQQWGKPQRRDGNDSLARQRIIQKSLPFRPD